MNGKGRALIGRDQEKNVNGIKGIKVIMNMSLMYSPRRWLVKNNEQWTILQSCVITWLRAHSYRVVKVNEEPIIAHSMSIFAPFSAEYHLGEQFRMNRNLRDYFGLFPIYSLHVYVLKRNLNTFVLTTN